MHLVFGWKVLSSMCAANSVEKRCCSRKPLKATSVERSGSKHLNSVFDSSVSACGNDIPSGMHVEMNSRNEDTTGWCMTTRPYITHHTSHITHHTSHITHHTSHITHHSSLITHHTHTSHTSHTSHAHHTHQTHIGHRTHYTHISHTLHTHIAHITHTYRTHHTHRTHFT